MLSNLLDKLVKKDTMQNGILIGIVLPLFTYALIYLTSEYRIVFEGGNVLENLQLLLIAINAIVMRYFMLTRDQENVGRGILMVTFMWVIGWVVYYHVIK